MNARPLKLVTTSNEDISAPGFMWLCAECSKVYSYENDANSCCKPVLCENCGTDANVRKNIHTKDGNRTLCKTCQDEIWEAARKEKEYKKFEKATKIRASEYKEDYFFCDDLCDGLCTFDDLDDYIGEYTEDHGKAPEPHLYAALECRPNVTVDDIDNFVIEQIQSQAEYCVEDICENAPKMPDKLKEELQKWLDEISKKVVWYEEDSSTAIILD